jgi:large subunit ribosomal protein L3
MQRCLAFKSGFVSGQNASLRAAGSRSARAAASRKQVVVQARQAEAGVGIFGTKAGMMTYFTEEGAAVPATVIALEEGNMVTMVKTQATDGYDAVQVGYKVVPERKVRKPELGHLKKAGCPPMKHLREFKVCSAAASTAHPAAAAAAVWLLQAACCSYPADYKY